MWAILSDIHGNLEALQAVLADAANHGAEQTICLGDTVGCGPDPIECLYLTMTWTVVLQGKFEDAVLLKDDLPAWGARHSAQSLFWCRRLISQLSQAATLWDYLATRPLRYEVGENLFIHGTPRDPLHEFLAPESIYDPQMMEQISQTLSGRCFNGQTHVPGIFIENAPGDWEFLSPEQCHMEHRFDDRKTICNVGSVGQPHDGDWRASYVLFDGEVARFRRVVYDVDTTIQKIYAIPELDNFLGDRLREGR